MWDTVESPQKVRGPFSGVKRGDGPRVSWPSGGTLDCSHDAMAAHTPSTQSVVPARP